MSARRLARGAGPLLPFVGEDVAASTVFVVDDSQANVAVLESLLTAAGLERVRGFTDPREALAHCADALPDLLLLDLHMPHVDGFEVMEKLKAMVPAGRYLPILVLTADITTSAKERALAAGAKDFLTKPFERTEVLLRVGNLLETRALHRHLEEHNAELRSTLEARTARDREAEAERERSTRRIDEALTPGALGMAFQPVADLTTGRIEGAEALARFACEPHRPPNEWFAEAEMNGRGHELELAAVATALEYIDLFPSDAFMSINVSPATVMTAALGELLSSYSADRVVIELTEHTGIADYGALLTALDGLRNQGVRIAVDDTGYGQESFARVLELRPDILKLDTSHTRGIDGDPIRRALAAALVTFAHEIDAELIAEGVEVLDELITLRRLGISLGQGYLLARPGPLPLPAVRLEASRMS